MDVSIDRIRARVIWLLARLRTTGANIDATISQREIMAACEIESVEDIHRILSLLPGGIVCDIDSRSVRIRTESAAPADIEAETIAIAKYWRDKTGRDGRTELTSKRLSLIRARLRAGRTVAELRRAVDLCAASEWHNGRNDRGTVYTDCEHIFTAERLDRWLSTPARQTENDSADSALRETILRRQRDRKGR